MTSLVPPHGGLAEPVCRTVPADAIDDFLGHARTLPQVPVSDADLSTVYRLGDGVLSPLVGPMDSAVYDRVLDEAVIEHDGKLYAWTIPLALPVVEALAKRLAPGQQAALVNTAGQIVATLEITDVYPWDKKKYLSRVYLTERTDHPGGDMVLKGDAAKTHLLGGAIRVLPQPKDPRFGKYVLGPREVRKLLAKTGWERVVAFQTRNPLHRAHEYALVYGLETLLRAGCNAGACLNPLIGETKGDDVDADVRMHTYEALIQNRVLGDGDSDPTLWGPRGESVPDRVILLGLDIKMFYGGPKEAVMHAIYRQNFGFTDIIIGRKHADAPYHDGSPIWGDFDAQEIFNHLAGDLRIRPLLVGFAAFYQSMGRVDLMDNHKDEKPVFISGKEVRKALLEGRPVDPRIMRESTAAILTAAMAKKQLPMSLVSYLLAAVSAVLVGLSKTGLPGVSIPAILLMTEAYADDARLSVGAILPVLLVGDVFAVAWFRQHADWGRLVRLLPYVVAGMLPGVFVLRALEGNQLRPVIGVLVLGMLAVEVCRQWFGWERVPHRWWFAAGAGVLAGFTTFVANAAMPVMSIYLVSQELDKRQFIGTAAWFFLILNLSKVPAYCAMGMLTPAMAPLAVALAPVTILGALLGVYVLARIPQRFFDLLALSLAGVAAIRLILV